MTLIEKIINFYPSLTINDFLKDGTIVVMNIADGKGDFIAAWNHPTLPRPTEEQLA